MLTVITTVDNFPTIGKNSLANNAAVADEPTTSINQLTCNTMMPDQKRKKKKARQPVGCSISCPIISEILSRLRGKVQSLAAKIMPMGQSNETTPTTVSKWLRRPKCATIDASCSIPTVSVVNTTPELSNFSPAFFDSPEVQPECSRLKAGRNSLSRNHLAFQRLNAKKSSANESIRSNNSVLHFNASIDQAISYLQMSDHFGHMKLSEQLSGSSQLSLGASAITPTLDSSSAIWPSAVSHTLDYGVSLSADSMIDHQSDETRSNCQSARSYANSECSGATTASQVRPATIAALLVLAAKNSNGSDAEPKMFNELLRNALLQVSVDTMAITALPLDCWLKERLKNWVQLSGHAGTIVPASNHTLWKKLPNQNTTEAVAYAKISADPALAGLTPKFYKEITHKNESFIEIQDLLARFPNTSSRAIMDIKMGVRTFLESEVSNTTKRTDLYKKMIDIDPNEPTEQERADEAITKLRYMQFRERESSTASLGFRIEAAQLPGGKLQKSFKKVHTKVQVINTLVHFFGERHVEICTQLVTRLRAMRDGIQKSRFFGTHEVVGSSILIVYDDTKTGAWMIDFAKSTTVPESITVNHRVPWTMGNHEDGYLIGLGNLIDILETAEKESRKTNVLTTVNK